MAHPRAGAASRVDPQPEGCRPPRAEIALARVESPGAEPRQPLRYETERAAPDSAANTADGAHRLVVREGASTWSVELAAAGGACFGYRAVAPPSGALARARPPFGLFLARPFGERWTQRGFHPRDGSVDGTQIMSEYVLEIRHDTAMQSVWLPLPATPVGVGARWSAERTVGRGGLTYREAHRFTLERDDGDRIVVTTEVDADAEPQFEVHANSVSEGLVASREHVVGHWTLRRGDPLPTGTFTVRSERRRGRAMPESVRALWSREDAALSAAERAYREQVGREGLAPASRAELERVVDLE